MKKRVFVFSLFLAGIFILLTLVVSVDAVLSGHACYDGTGFRVYQKDLPGCSNIDCSECGTATGSPCTGTPAPTYYDCKTSEWDCNLLNIAEIKPEDFKCKTSGKYVEVYMGKSSMTTLVPVEKIKGYYVTYPDACIQGARFFERWDTNFKKCVEIVDGKEIYHGFLIGTRCSTDTDIVSVSDTEFGQTATKYQRCSGWCPPPHVFSCSPPGSPVTETGCQKDGEVCYSGWNDINKNGESEETKGNCYSGKCAKICPEGTPIEGKPCKVCDGTGEEKNALNGINCVAQGISDGFCKDGTCVERNCESIYGADFKNCGPRGGKTSCCKKSDICCVKEDKTAVCCNPKEAECGGAFGYNYCKGKDCEKRGFKTCTASWLPEIKICCPPDKKCGINKDGEKETPFCGDDNCDMPGYNPVPCVNGKNGEKLCCKNSESCVDVIGKDGKKTGKKACSANTCSSEETICRGGGTNWWKTLCCAKGTTCFLHPSGYPTCVDIPPSQGSAAGGPGTIKSLSLYLYRNPSDFSRNGEAYRFIPHGLQFNSNVTLNINNFSEGDILYKYEDDSYFKDCSIEIINEWKKNMSSEGGNITNSEFSLIVPTKALNESAYIIADKISINCPAYCEAESTWTKTFTENVMLAIKQYYQGNETIENVRELISAWKEGF